MVLPESMEPIRVRDLEMHFGQRTYVMGIVNVTPDSFSGDGLLEPHASGKLTSTAGSDPTDYLGALVRAAVAQAERMVAEGADIIDVGGESTRPGHDPVTADEERERVVEAVSGIRARFRGLPISIDTSKPDVAEAALAAGADILNDVAAVTGGAALASVASAHGAPYVLMHGRSQPEYADVVAEVVEDLGHAIDRALSQGCGRESIIVDPGIGFGKTVQHNLSLLGALGALRVLKRPILLGTSRKSTIGAILDLPVEQRLEGTLATTALGVAAGVDIVRVHDVAANVRTARMSDAIIRGGWTRPRN